jgi:ATP-dependent RNA helicase DeaD
VKQALSDALAERGYETLTPVQEAVMAPELVGRDLLVSAQTGSGKTLGFGLAIAPTLLDDADAFDRADAPLALVIAPTRELAMQVKRELEWLYAKAGAVMASCVGGMDMRDERRILSRGSHIVVATPGRLRDHIMRGSIDLKSIRAVVLDEADEMLDLGFREDLEFILGEAPETRQTLLFSATVPNSIAGLAKSYQKDAQRIVTQSKTSQHADISYRAMLVSDRDTDNAVINALRYYEAPNAIVFGNTRAMVNRLTTRLSNRGFQVVALSGELSQSERTHALQAMRDGRAQVCVATDVAARGIDLPNLDLVIHAELPSNHETLLHRSGRTGRAGRKGVSALVVTKKTRKKAERILHMAKLKSEWGMAPTADEVNARDEERMMASPDWQVEISDAERAGVDSLVEGFTGEQLAAAYLRMYRSMRSAPEDLSDVDTKPVPRQEFGPSVWFSVSGGRDAGAEPRRLLPMLCNAGDITKDDIGAIRIRDDQSFVQIKESSVAGFLAAIGNKTTLEEGAVLTQLAEAPAMAPSGHGPKPAYKGGAKTPYKGKGDGKSDYKSDRKPAYKSEGKPDYKSDKKPAYKSEGKSDYKSDKKPAYKSEGKSDYKSDKKPAYKSEGKSDYKSDKKPAYNSANHDTKPAYNPDADRPAPKPRANATPPVDWNDDPTPRPRKPKPGGKPGGGYGGKPGGKPGGGYAGKPGGKPGGGFGGKPGGKPSGGGYAGKSGGGSEAANDGVRKPRHKPGATDPSRRMDGPPDGARPYKPRGDKPGGDRPNGGKPRSGPKGPPPPKGKASSKKNKARTEPRTGGQGAPRRNG